MYVFFFLLEFPGKLASLGVDNFTEFFSFLRLIIFTFFFSHFSFISLMLLVFVLFCFFASHSLYLLHPHHLFMCAAVSREDVSSQNGGSQPCKVFFVMSLLK